MSNNANALRTRASLSILKKKEKKKILVWLVIAFMAFASSIHNKLYPLFGFPFMVNVNKIASSTHNKQQ
jgi:uncharacterized membrane protein